MIESTDARLGYLKWAYERGLFRAESEVCEPFSLPLPEKPTQSDVWHENDAAINLDLARLGYLESPRPGQAKLIRGLPVLAEELHTHDAAVYWSDLVGACEGNWLVVSWSEKTIRVSRRYWQRDEAPILRALGVALGHIVLQAGDEREAIRWSQRRFGVRA